MTLGNSFLALEDFVRPMIGLAAWNVKLGHGSFLTFEFGEPIEGRSRRSDAFRGCWHLWIYCCHWRASQYGAQLAWSENSRTVIECTARALDGRRLLAVSIKPESGRSIFKFEAGFTLDTWPYGNNPTNEQWMILSENEAFVYRADGRYSRQPSDTPPDLIRWSNFL